MRILAVRDEWNVRSGKKGCDGWNIWLGPDGTIHTHLSFFESRSFKVDKREAERLFALNGERPMQLVMQAAQRAELVHAVNGGIWRVHPELPKAVDEAIAAYHSVRAPLYKLSPIQEVAIYITDESEVERCFMDTGHRAADVQVDGDVSIDFALQDLVAHLQIPEVPDVAECNPAGFDQHLQRLSKLEELINGTTP